MAADAGMTPRSSTIPAAPSEAEGRPPEIEADTRLCEMVLGEPLTSFVAGAESLGQYRAWLSGHDGDLRSIAVRLAATRRVILVFEARNTAGLATAWLREVGVAAEVPARMIRHKGDDESVATHLVEAAAKWLTRYSMSSAVAA